MGFEAEPLFQCMTFALVAVGTGCDEGNSIEASTCGDTMRLRIRNPSDEVIMSVVGKSYDELGAQLALACLRNVSIERLRTLHRTPLQEATPVIQRVK